MSETANKLFNALAGMKDAVLTVAPGVLNFGPEMKAELSRLGTQGAMELAGALFGSNAFVPYGPGQYTPTPSPKPEHEHGGQERGMER